MRSSTTQGLFVLTVICVAVSGCSSNKILQATGGSRSDGIVNLSYEAGLFEKPIIDWDQANAVALKRCEAWGYTSAEAFGGVNTQCQAFNGYGQCVRAFVTVPYQCTNQNAEIEEEPNQQYAVPTPTYVPVPQAPASAPAIPTPEYVPVAPAPAYVQPAPAPAYTSPPSAPSGVPPATARAYTPPAVGKYDPYAIDPY